LKKYKIYTILLIISLLNLVFFTNFVLAEEKKTSNINIEDYKKRLAALLKPDIQPYEIEGKKDPFIPFIRQKVAVSETEDTTKPKVCANPIECLDIGQLQVVAIIRCETGALTGMVQDATTQGYVIYEGMKIGYKDGRVIKIDSEGVVISESGRDVFGNQAKKEKILLIHPEER